MLCICQISFDTFPPRYSLRNPWKLSPSLKLPLPQLYSPFRNLLFSLLSCLAQELLRIVRWNALRIHRGKAAKRPVCAWSQEKFSNRQDKNFANEEVFVLYIEQQVFLFLPSSTTAQKALHFFYTSLEEDNHLLRSDTHIEAVAIDLL